MKTVGIIGAGKVGVSFGIGLFSSGPVCVGGYFSRTKDSAVYGATKTSSKVYDSLDDLVEDNDVILIATPDDAVESVWRQLLELNIEGKIVCHTAGSLSSSVFFDRTTKGAYVASIHPMLAVASKDTSYRALGSAFFTIEGDPEAVEVLKKVLEDGAIRYKVLEGADKSAYHLATSLISNSVIALGSVAVDLLKGVGFTEQEALKALKPLGMNNLENFFELGAEDALTGPVERGDVETVKRHLSVLEGDEKKRALYVAASRILAEIARNKHPERDGDAIEDLLKGVYDEESNR
ncbi:MAG: Rossmann-like and DUF2520 domain-containing protein [Peptoniphilus sp.]|nr:Rossmann-like and DUF2520 domain-containing protein [Peptoniphilus sp.]MDY6045094.1 Rossmann-like and DUF2520 domain-containing protein [Peptoniphilus sp.]